MTPEWLILDRSHLVLALHRIDAVKFGDFKLKSGRRSPVYVDLRVLVGHPDVLRQVGHIMVDTAKQLDLQFDRIAGIPYAGLPIAVATSLAGPFPMIYARKQVKEHGTRQLIEGQYQPGDRILTLDDVITDGGAKIEGVAPFVAAGLVAEDVLVLVDREQGGSETLAEAGMRLSSVYTLREIITTLLLEKKISEDQFATVTTYLEDPESYPQG